MAIILPTIALAVLVVQQNYNWIFGLMIGSALAFSSCELIQKAVNNSFVRKSNRSGTFFLIGFFLRFILFAALLYFAIVLFKINPIAIVTNLLSYLSCEFTGEKESACLNINSVM